MEKTYAVSALSISASLVGIYRQTSCRCSASAADAIVNFESLRCVAERYLNIGVREFMPIGHAVNHDPLGRATPVRLTRRPARKRPDSRPHQPRRGRINLCLLWQCPDGGKIADATCPV